MKRSRRAARVLLVVAVVAVGVGLTTAAQARKAANIKVCVLLPDTKSSVRWVQFDAPDFAKALKKAHVTYSITNALNDPQKMVSQADSCSVPRGEGGDRHRHRAGHIDRDREEVRQGRRGVDRLRPSGGRRDREGLCDVRRQGRRRRPGKGRHLRPEGGGK